MDSRLRGNDKEKNKKQKFVQFVFIRAIRVPLFFFAVTDN